MSRSARADNQSVGPDELAQPRTTPRTAVADIVIDHQPLRDWNVWRACVDASADTIHRVRP